MYSEIERLLDIDVAVQLPDISRSLKALDEAMRDRLQAGDRE